MSSNFGLDNRQIALCYQFIGYYHPLNNICLSKVVNLHLGQLKTFEAVLRLGTRQTFLAFLKSLLNAWVNQTHIFILA